MGSRVLVRPAKCGLLGEVTVPADKSLAHRALILGSCARGQTRISNFAPGADNVATLKSCQALGVSVEWKGKEALVSGRGWEGLSPPSAVIDCANSGTTMRLVAGLLAGRSFVSRLDGDQSLRRRPMQRIIEPLSKMGARIESHGGNGCAPLTIHGMPLVGCLHRLKVASAQVKSAILLAGLQASGVTTIIEPGHSRDHTERMLPAFGAYLSVKGMEIKLVGPQELEGADVELVGDISSAAFFIVAAALVPGSRIVVRRVGLNPTRTGILDLLAEMGADISIDQGVSEAGEPVGSIEVQASRLIGVQITGDKLLRAIDEFPLLCVAAALAEGETVITGAAELRLKESDRIAAMGAELRKLGVELEEMADGIRIRGCDRLGAARVDSHGDHRVAMALAVAGLVGGGTTEILGGEVVEVSFPDFFATLKALSCNSVEVG